MLRGPSLTTVSPSDRKTMRQNRFPPGWNEERVQKVLRHYEEQTEDEAVLGVAEDAIERFRVRLLDATQGGL